MPVFYGLRPVSYLEKYIIENNIETIITSHTQLTSYRFELKRKLDLTWFADFRDPWTTIGYHKAFDYQITPLKA
jgi:hypothetical protein